MNELTMHIAVYVLSFIAVWIGAGLIVSSVSTLAHTWRLSAFTISFFLLGMLTSLPEMTIGVLSFVENDPTVAVGNLLGGAILLFLAIIPLLGVLGNGVPLPKSLSNKEILLILAVVIAPSLLTSDQRLTPWEGAFLLILYGVLFVFLFQQNGLIGRLAGSIKQKSKRWELLLGKIGIGVLVLVAGSQQIINSTLYFGEILQVSPFVMGLIVISLGTNIPEFSLIVRSLMQNRKDIALADYLGSAVANTPILGVLSVFSARDVILPNHYLHRLFFLSMGLLLFYFFSRSNRKLSLGESFIIFSGYVLFLIVEIYLSQVS